MVKDILKDKDYMFITRHYWKLLFTYIGVLYAIDPMLGIFAFSFPAACVYFAAGAFGVIPHSKHFGYLVPKQFTAIPNCTRFKGRLIQNDIPSKYC